MNFEYEGIALVPVIMALAEGLKALGFNKKYIPVVNVIFGLVGGMIYLNPSDLKMGILQGVIMGLASSGLYSGVKNVSEGIKQEKVK